MYFDSLTEKAHHPTEDIFKKKKLIQEIYTEHQTPKKEAGREGGKGGEGGGNKLHLFGTEQVVLMAQPCNLLW